MHMYVAGSVEHQMAIQHEEGFRFLELLAPAFQYSASSKILNQYGGAFPFATVQQENCFVSNWAVPRTLLGGRYKHMRCKGSKYHNMKQVPEYAQIVIRILSEHVSQTSSNVCIVLCMLSEHVKGTLGKPGVYVSHTLIATRFTCVGHACS